MKLIVISIIFFFHIMGIKAGILRIVNGKNAPDNKYPYQVYLQLIGLDGKHYSCGGSIIDKRWILTAAHCIEDTASALVLAGSNHIKKVEEANVYKSERMVAHKDWNPKTKVNDIGLIFVNRDIQFNDKVKPVKLPTQDFTKVNYPAVFVGWGHLGSNKGFPDNLQEITLKIIDQKECDKRFDKSITKFHICTLNKAGEGPCVGDSDGPLVADGVEIGIDYFTNSKKNGEKCSAEYPEVFTRVFSFMPWIKKKF